MYIVPKIIKDELGEDVYNKISEICNQLRPEREIVIWGNAQMIDKIEQAIENEFKQLINYKNEKTI
jgi:succinyl-CoA synthetase alpha subunit